MQVDRVKFLATLQKASVGLSSRELLEQSNCFIFHGGDLITFNDEIMARAKSPIELEGAIPAKDLIGVLSKIPDETLEVIVRENEIVLKGMRRRAGITLASDIHLPINEVPMPTKWMGMGENVFPVMLQASLTCGKDATQYLTTCVHVTPELIEACDNNRMLRAELTTGFPNELLIPASSLDAIRGLTPKKFCIGKGWLHFQMDDGEVISLRCSYEKYFSGIDKALVIKNAEEIKLPANLKDIIGRAEVMAEGSKVSAVGYDSRVTITIKEGLIKVRARKETGWYEEQKRVVYSGPTLIFEVHPHFLMEVMERSRKVLLNNEKMMIKTDKVQFVVSLYTKEEEEE